jgi:hypothetical protein
MNSHRMMFGLKMLGPALLAAILMSACVGVPLSLEAPSRGTVSMLSQINNHSCTPSVASVIDAYRVPSQSIQDLFYTQRLSGQGRLLGYTAWMHLTDQPGSLVVDVDRSCQFEQAYTRGGANLPGLYQSYF